MLDAQTVNQPLVLLWTLLATLNKEVKKRKIEQKKKNEMKTGV